ncbi:MAG: hypothetical protein ACYDGR_12460 [Candidatus Dormibacteria bacterium]
MKEVTVDSEEKQLAALRQAFAKARGDDEPSEVIDISGFQARLARVRELNQRAVESAPATWATKVTEIQEQVSRQRVQMEDALLEGMLGEEDAMIARLEDMERNLRNMTRLYKQLMDERNSMVAGIDKLHSWIRQLETRQKRKPHRDHGRDLGQKSFIEYMSKQAWMFDNSKGWELEETPTRQRKTAG